MKKHPILLVLLAILIVQPLVTGSIGNLATGTRTPDSDGVHLPAAGFRLAPQDLTDHVPIIIDEDADFVSQGWPGTGTSGDPYVISGLNITYANGQDSIEISDVTEYYVIRDCYINQGSFPSMAMHLNNASNGLVEHNTILSSGGGIALIECNDTSVYHNEITNYGDGSFEFSIYAGACWDLEIEWNVCYSDANTVAGFEVCHSLLMNNNYFEAGDTVLNVGLFASNNTVANHNSIVSGSSGLVMEDCFYNTFDNLTITEVVGLGVILDTDVYWFELSNSYIQSLGPSLVVDSCANISIIDSHFVALDDDPVVFFGSYDIEFFGNTIEGSGDDGIIFEDCHRCSIDSNTIDHDSWSGLIVVISTEVSIVGNNISAYQQYGIYMEANVEVNIESNEIYGDYGEANIFLLDVINGTLIGNTLDRMMGGVLMDACYNLTVSGNSFYDGMIGFIAFPNTGPSGLISLDHNIVTHCMAGIGFMASFDIEISYNEIYDAEDAIVVQGTTNVSIHHNIVDGCEGVGRSDGGLNTTFNYNTATNCEYQGFEFVDISIGQAIGNSISSPVDGGLVFDNCIDFNVTDNVLTDCGIVFDTGGILSSYNHTFSNNLVNSLPVYYSVSEESATINPVSYGQIILVNCTDIDITGKTWDSVTIPIQIYYSVGVEIDDLTTTSNKYGIQAYQSENVNITDITSSGDESSAVYLDTCIYFIIEGLVQNGGDYGARLDGCDYGTFYLCTIDQSSYGIYAESTNDMDIMNCDLTNIENSGIYGTGNYVKVLDSHISNTFYGVRVDGGDFWNITNNLIEYCTHGISLISSAQNGVAHNNEIYSSVHHGIILNTGCNNWEITNNTILWSAMWGIHAYQVNGLYVYYNTIGLSGTGNADDTNSNTWDDTVDTGNWWSDYDGVSPTYPIPGGGGVDYYPMSFLPDTPLIQYPIDISYAEGSTGNTASWIVFDNYLSHYRVTIDGAIIVEDAFAEVIEDTATVDIDGLAYGDHPVIITVWDIEDNTATDTIMVHVFDDTDPTINGPPNMEIFVGGSGQEITWEVSDLHPDTYTVELDGEEYATGSWTNGELSINIDGLTAGEHVLVLYIYDVDGNEISDGVVVLVIDDSVAPAVDSPDDLVIILGTTGNSIIWTPTDVYPASYAVSSNGSVYASGDWGGSRIAVVVDGLPLGNHTFTLTVEDGSGSSATDTVTVTVLPFEGWTPEPAPLDYTIVLIVVGAVAGVIVLAVVVYFVKFKKS